MSRPPNARKDLDSLIDWYEKNRPGQTFDIQIRIAFCTAQKFCAAVGDTLTYRGHNILPINETGHCNKDGIKKKASA